MDNLEIKITDKLRDIAKAFFNRAAAWGTQLKSGLDSARETMLSAVQNIVDEINAIIKRVRSISIGFDMPNIPPLGGFGNNGGNGGGGGMFGGGQAAQNRASGAPVIGGQLYNVEEFMRQEVFRAPVNGRVDPIDRLQPAVARIDDAQIQILASVIGASVVKALNNV
jgi:hypothetical protein